MTAAVLAIDQGTTSSRAIIFDDQLQIIGVGQKEFPQHFPRSGWVEHTPEDLWSTTLETCRTALAKAGLSAGDLTAIGITNQRETTVVWEKKTGKPVYPAIVWQDRRTSEMCQKLKADGHEPAITARSGLLLDPYFSGTKIAWILNTVEGARTAAERGDLLFGTVDCYLIWQLTGGRVHATDATNAARTMIYDIRKGAWDAQTCALLDIPMAMLPKVKNCADNFGTTDSAIFGAAVPILGVAGDQQAATIGQACFVPGMMKSTYGTGCFALLNTGSEMVRSKNRLLTTIAYQLDGKVTYALEGSIFVAGAVVQWLRDGLKIIDSAGETAGLATKADAEQDVILVPGFTGLGAPYWNAESRGAIYGLTRNSGPAELAKAALESVGFQTRDLIEAMLGDWQNAGNNVLRVDGGMTASDWTMQFLADILNAPVDRPQITETTAVGAAWLAGMKAGIYPDQQGFSKTWKVDKRFEPQMDEARRAARYARWKRAVQATMMV